MDRLHDGAAALGADGLAGLRQCGDGVGRRVGVEVDLVGLPLVMEAGGGDGLLQRLVELHDVQQDLEGGGDDARSAGRTEGEHGAAVLEDDGGGHARQRAFAGADEVGAALLQAEEVGLAGDGEEVVHLVVEDDAEGLGHDE